MRHSILILIFTLSVFQLAIAQTDQPKPKLVVGIVVDQMRYDYITRYWDLFGNDGFKKLVNNGYNFSNAHYEYVPTYTAAGHANIATGAIPAMNGIVGNEWFDRAENKVVYCAEDKSVSTIGSTSKAGLMSPKRLLSTTFGDELRLGSNFKSRVFGIALKDRGAILSTGTSANAAYWFDDVSGNFITSSYYMKELPAWVNAFNDLKLPSKYLKQVWKPLTSMVHLQQVSIEDRNPYEEKYKGVEKSVFPYDLAEISKNQGIGLIRTVPAGNTLTTDFAKELILKEKLGKNGVTDLLMLSYSTPDYIGHQFGPRSVEVADMYLRLDQDMAGFLSFLETNFPNKDYVIFLTADHGVSDNPQFLNDQKLKGGNFDNSIIANLREQLMENFGDDLILHVENLQIYLDYKKIKDKKISKERVVAFCTDFLQQFEPISKAIPGDILMYATSNDPMIVRYAKGYHARRSGDIAIVLDPGFIEMRWQLTGTTHGSGYSYDTHVPIIWYGMGINPGTVSHERVSVSDIAPTISSLLQIAFPNGTVGKILPVRKLKE